MTSEMSPQEKRIVDLKYKSLQIGNMVEGDLMIWGKSLLLKIHVITGWTIPASDEMLNVLIDQFTKYLFERYPELNPDEIEYAFRKSGTVIEDWGKNLNLNLVDKVLVPYLNERYKVSEMEEKLKHGNPEQKIFSQEELDNSAREDAERQYQSFLKGRELLGLGINKCILEKDGLLKEDEGVLDFFKRMAESGYSNIYVYQKA